MICRLYFRLSASRTHCYRHATFPRAFRTSEPYARDSRFAFSFAKNPPEPGSEQLAWLQSKDASVRWDAVSDFASFWVILRCLVGSVIGIAMGPRA